MITKEELKNKLDDLIKDYQSYSKEDRDSMSEDDTRRKFIDRLLKDVLGWDEKNIDSQTPIESLTPEGHMKRADYSYPKIPKIIVEAKKLKIRIDDGDFDKQVTDYAYSKAVNWAILTNFKSFRVWHVTRKKIDWFCRLNILEDNLDQTVDELFYFTKENIFNGTLDKRAEVRGIKLQEIDITADLTESLNISRQRINNYLKKNYIKYSENEREELTQGVINRLIFIKKVEAEGLEENKLEQLVRKERNKVYDKIIEIFAYYRRKYDSDIFGSPEEKAEVEKLEIDDSFSLELLKVISNPIDSDRAYNFAAMDVDVLGSIYENYLAYIQKGIKLIGGKEKRKAQGIYYTPRYIVDFITKNTIGNLLKNGSPNRVKDIKIIDPACGSGSFLVNTVEKFDEYYKGNYKNYVDLSTEDRLRLIKNNIYGVDLDERAVSIAKLNIYLKVLTQKGQGSVRAHHALLPELRTNIKLGNSLIDDENIAGDKAFKWDEEFKDIITNGGFDVVIGNPPYVRQEELTGMKKWFQDYEVFNASNDLYTYFFERGIKLLKDNGLFGFIVSSKFTKTIYGKELRQFIIDNTKILQFIDFGDLPVFQEATTYPCIIILQKNRNRTANKKNKILVSKVKSLIFDNLTDEVDSNSFYLLQETLSSNPWVFENAESIAIKTKIENKGIPLKKFIGDKLYRGITTGFNDAFIIDANTRKDIIEKNQKAAEVIKPFLTGKNIKKNSINFGGLYLIFSYTGIDINKYPEIKEHLLKYKAQLDKVWEVKNKKHPWYELRGCSYYDKFQKTKIIYPRINVRPNFVIDYEGYFTQDSSFIIPSDSKYLVGVLNSRLMQYYAQKTCSMLRGGYYDYRYQYVELFPIAKGTPEQIEKIESMVDELTELNKKLNELGDKNTSKRAQIEEKIREREAVINELVFKIYEINREEKKIIEDSLL
jgi:type I restriction-modification system DNA methylase subunit